MTVLHTVAHAKLNLTLDVLGTRPDGYHDLRSVMQEIDLEDEITLTLDTAQPWQMICGAGDVPCDDTNLCIKAAQLFFRETGLEPNGLTVSVEKRIPVQAGMGGGSADGAAVLRLLWKHYRHPFSIDRLYALGEMVGSDVPFCLHGAAALAEEKGQVLSDVPSLRGCCIVVCKPDFPISTPALFRAIDREPLGVHPDSDAMIAALRDGDWKRAAALLGNVFEPIVAREHPEVDEIRRAMLHSGAENAAMTGSGPTVFGLFADETQAKACLRSLSRQHRQVYLCHPV